MPKYGTFRYGEQKYGTEPTTPFPPNLTYKSIPVAVQIRKDIGEKVIYRVRQGNQQKYKYFIPTNPQTTPQQAWRATFAAGRAAASALTPEEREPYKERAREIGNIHWHNVFISDYLWEASHGA